MRVGVSVHVESLSPENSSDYEIERKLCKRCASLCKGHCSDDDELMKGQGGSERGAEVGEGVRAAWISRGRVARTCKVRSIERKTVL